jgi:hypothetical protein
MKMKYSCRTAILLAILAFNASATVRYVDINNVNPMPPYTDWATAAVSIQDAIDLADSGDQILVTNGVYETGGRVVYGAMTNRVVVDKPITVLSVNGPAATAIRGYQVPGYTNGDAAIRCVYLTNGASLSGFTLVGGATREAGDFSCEQSGGGVWCASRDAVISNCILTGNAAYYNGGGAFSGTLDLCALTSNSVCYYFEYNLNGGGGAFSSTLNNCTLTGNISSCAGGGVYRGTLTNCTLTENSARFGGGASESTLNNCTLTTNKVTLRGGGVMLSVLTNCVLMGNSAYFGGGSFNGTLANCLLFGNSSYVGGGVLAGTLNNCTLTGNSATNGGGGANFGTLNNCIIYFNSASDGANYNSSILDYCCTIPMPTNGTGTITNAPLFVDQANGDFRLQTSSPCINAGNNAYASGLTTDLDGNPRIQGGTVDIGAYELQAPASRLSYAWAQQYGLPTDGSADYVDTDGDRLNNWQEWLAGTIPNDPASVLKLLPPVPGGGGTTVSWLSVSNRTYFLERSTNLAAQPAFVTVQSNLTGLSGVTSCADTNAVGEGQVFYRIGLQP